MTAMTSFKPGFFACAHALMLAVVTVLSGAASAPAASPSAAGDPSVTIASANEPVAQARAPQAQPKGQGGIAGGCQVICAPNLIQENEPCGANTVNCGCDCPAAQNFQVLRCIEGYCSTSWAMNNQHDTDWYLALVNTDPNNDGQAYICFTVQSDFPAVVQIHSGPCGSLTLLNQIETDNCQTVTVCACVPAPGQYRIKVFPGTIAGGPINNGIPCGRYWIRYSCNDACPVTGACCYQHQGLPGFQCIETTQADCQGFFNSTWLGPNTTCAGDPCNQTGVTGACCYIDPAGVPQCAVTTQLQCQNLGGTWQGANTNCLPPNPCETGACCYVDAAGLLQCVVTTLNDCHNNLMGNWQGPNTNCLPPNPCVTGACCYQQPGQTNFLCIVTTQANCATLFNSTWLGPNTNCGAVGGPDPCNPPAPTGACCYFDAVGPQCIVTTQVTCTQTYNGTWLGPNTSCQPNPCVTGACCYRPAGQTNSLCTITTQANCATLPNSVWLGANTSCTPDPCNPPPPVGACCYLTPIGSQCAVVSQAACANYPGGTWLGPNTSCQPNPCVTGACCYHPAGQTNSLCTITTQANCATLPNSVWLGASTSCTPDPCNPPPPLGACCFQDGPQAQVMCVVVSQAACMNYPNGVWQGPNTTCSPNPCPQLGACCTTATDPPSCIVTTQANCLQSGGIYLGNGVPCTPWTCLPCVHPPPNMVAWWTLDEFGGGISHDSAAAHHGAWKPTSTTGPTPAFGYVDGSLMFDGVNDYVEVAPAADLNFNCGAFSIDAWVYPQATNPPSVGGIVRKQTSGPGYELLRDTTGQIILVLTSSSLRCVPTSVGTAPVNTWTHVAVTASAAVAGNRTVRFYINGAPSGTFVTPCDCLGNNAPLYIGNSTFGFWRGRLDEIQMFNRELAGTEINAIYSSGVLGKCKHHCHVPWDRPFCLNQNQITVPVTVCNDSPNPGTFNVSFQPEPTGPNCSIPGPTVFTPLFSNPLNIAGNTCVTVNVVIQRPTGMNAVLQVGCYQVNVTNLNTGQVNTCHGSVQDRRDLCAVLPPCCISTVTVEVGTTQALQFQVTNTTGQPQTFAYELKPYSSTDMEPSEVLSLNGLPPGTRYIGNLTLQPNETQTIDATARYLAHEPLAFTDVVLSSSMGAEGPAGGFVALISATLQSVPHVCVGDIAPPPGDGQVNFDDILALIFVYGPCAGCPEDLNGDGQVNFDDILIVIFNYGPCS